MSTSSYRPPKPHVVIVGGGLAGLAVAASLVGRGLRITLLESRPRLGGRAGSFTDPATGGLVDNCQHVSMACCTNLADFCRKVGTSDLFRKVPRLVFLGEDGRESPLEAGPLPAPFHLSGSFLRAKYLTIGEKIRVAYGLARLRYAKPDSVHEPFGSWLRRHGQTERTIDRYWGTVLVSALNERIDQMDLGHARKVFLDGFLRNRHGYVMEVPTVPLGELYGTRLEGWLRERGVDVRMTTGVRSVRVDEEGNLSGVELRTGEAIDADFVVLSVPFDRVGGLLKADTIARIPSLAPIDQIQSSPITGVHLWFDRPVCPREHVVTIGRTVQWVFNHSASGTGGGQYLQLVISAAYDLLTMRKEAIRDLALADLEAMWPEAREANLLRWWVVTEHGATFAVRPGIDSLRPHQRTPVEGLFLCGDWTNTGWPATMEGAVRSGYLAAEHVLLDLGRPDSLVRPDLPDGFLARMLLGPPSGPPPRPRVPRLLEVREVAAP